MLLVVVLKKPDIYQRLNREKEGSKEKLRTRNGMYGLVMDSMAPLVSTINITAAETERENRPNIVE